MPDHRNPSPKRLTSFVGMAAMMCASLIAFAPAAAAQDDRYETCAAYGTMVGTGGSGSVAAAAVLKALAAPNPPGIDAALDIVIDAEDEAGDTPSLDEIEAAYTTLDDYYGDLCRGLDICPLIRQAVASNDGSSAYAASLARGITAPAPPGIDAALALIAGEVDESPFHSSVAEAQQQIDEYFQCRLAVTGPTSASTLTMLGLGLILAGAAMRYRSDL